VLVPVVIAALVSVVIGSPVEVPVPVAVTLSEADIDSVPVGAVMLACESLIEPLTPVEALAESESEFEPSVTLADTDSELPPVLLAPPSVALADAVSEPLFPQPITSHGATTTQILLLDIPTSPSRGH
jgi:hypothetical protein